jgi:hypothetical protein
MGAKYLDGNGFSHFTVAEETRIKNLGRAAPDLVFSPSPSSRTQTYVRKFNPAV